MSGPTGNCLWVAILGDGHVALGNTCMPDCTVELDRSTYEVFVGWLAGSEQPATVNARGQFMLGSLGVQLSLTSDVTRFMLPDGSDFVLDDKEIEYAVQAALSGAMGFDSLPPGGRRAVFGKQIIVEEYAPVVAADV